MQLLVAPPQLVAALRVLLGKRPAQPTRLLPGLLAPLPLLLQPDARLPLPLPRLEGRTPPGLRRLPLPPGRLLRPLQVRVQPLQSGESSSEDMYHSWSEKVKVTVKRKKYGLKPGGG